MSHINVHIPHPVIKPNGGDYCDPCHFQVSILDSPINDKIMHIHYSYDLVSDTLNDLINNNKAEFVLIAKCVKTYHRTIHCTTKKEEIWALDVSNYASVMSLTPYVIATKEIHMNMSDEHDDELAIMLPNGVDLQAGSILAIGKEYSTQFESIPNMEAATKLVIQNDLPDNTYKIMTDQEHIAVHLSPRTYTMVVNLRNNNRDVLYPSIYLSVVETAIRDLKDHEGRGWTLPLANALHVAGIATDDKDDLAENANEYAQKILRNPLGKLANFSGSDDDD